MCSTRSTDLEVCPTRPTDLEAWPWLTWLTLSVRLACACARVVGVGPPGWPWGVSHSPVWLWRVTPSPGCPWGMTSDSPGWSWPCAWRVRARRWFRLCAAPAEPPAPRASAAPPGSPAEPSRSHTPSPGQIVRKLIRPEWRWWTAIVSYNANSNYHILTIPSNLTEIQPMWQIHIALTFLASHLRFVALLCQLRHALLGLAEFLHQRLQFLTTDTAVSGARAATHTQHADTGSQSRRFWKRACCQL